MTTKDRKVRLFLDTANIQDIKESILWGCFSGITMNPIILNKETNDYLSHIRKILEITPNNWDISIQGFGGSTEQIIRQARVIRSWDRRIRVKIPVTLEGIKAAYVLAKEMPLNMTIVKSLSQIVIIQSLASQIESSNIIISIFCGRLNQVGYDWRDIIKSAAEFCNSCKILAASIKTPRDLTDAILLGASIVTAPLEIYKQAIKNALVEEDLKIFNKVFQDGKLIFPEVSDDETFS